MTAVQSDQIALSKSEAYRVSGIGRKGVEALIASGELATFTMPGQQREKILRSELEAAIGRVAAAQ